MTAKLTTDENGEKLTSSGVDHTTHYHNLNLFITNIFTKFLEKTVKNYFQLDNPFVIINGLLELMWTKFHEDFDPLLYYLQIKYPTEVNMLVSFCIPFRDEISQALIDRVYKFKTPTQVLVVNKPDVILADEVTIDEQKANALWYFLMILELFQGTIRGIFPPWFVRKTIDALKIDLHKRNVELDAFSLI